MVTLIHLTDQVFHVSTTFMKFSSCCMQALLEEWISTYTFRDENLVSSCRAFIDTSDYYYYY